ncbi:MAG: tetratricopeptide repeat protein [Acidobacteria bacterium]|nr:tetratricopeptide repeat protein [Acidobacteriota bacterium]
MALKHAVPAFRYSVSLMVVGLGVLASGAGAQSIDRATRLFNEAKYAEAKGELVAVQKANERVATAPYFLGRIAMIGNDQDEAIRQFERAVQLEDANALYHYWLGSALGEAAKRANVFRAPLLARRVRKEWERAVELDPNQVDARIGLVGFYAQAPSVMGGSMDKARAQAAEIAKRNAMRGAMSRGDLAQYEEKPAAEIAAYQQATLLAPDSVVAFAALADALVRAGKPDEALAATDEFARRRPDDPWALYNTGRISGLTGLQIDRGEAALKRFLAAPASDASAPTIALSHYYLGKIAEKRGAKDVARVQYQTALKINPKSRLSQQALNALK